MNGPGDLPLQHYSSTPDANNCSIISIIPNLGMSSCRGRAEDFARRLSSKLRTLGSQADDSDNSQEDEPIINGGGSGGGGGGGGGVGTAHNTWVSGHESQQVVTALQPLRHESDSFFDFDCELESPGSPVDECEYLRLIESNTNTPHNSAPESGYACASAASSDSSSDGPYYDVNSESETSQQQLKPCKKKQSSQTQQPSHTCPPSHLGERDEVDCAKQPSTLVNLCNGHDSPTAKNEFPQSPESQHLISNNVTTKSLPSEGPDIEKINPTPQQPEHTIQWNSVTPKLQEQILKEPQMQKRTIQRSNSVSSTLEEQILKEPPKPEPITQRNSVSPTLQEQILKEPHKPEGIIQRNSVSPTLQEQILKEPQKPEGIIQRNRVAPTLQEQILHELQKHSQDITDEELAIEDNKNNLPADIAIKIEPEAEPSVTENKDDICKVIHNLINGHAENGEEILKIEVCKLEKPCKEEVIESVNLEKPKIQDAKVLTELKPDLTTVEAKIPDLTALTELRSPKQEQPETKTQHLHIGLHHHDTDDEDDGRPQPIRRCSSLKTGKTPPGTPGRKKIVRFADVLGLDLADIKTFLDEIPTIPKSAYEDLEILDTEPPLQMGPKTDKLLMPLFQQPAGLANFLDIVRTKQVSLENAAVTDTINHTITGTVRVRNLDFHKSVHIRYSLDGWRSFADLKANYVQNSCDGFSDKFTFVLFGNSLRVGQRLEFAVRFQCKGQQYWDNNYDSNYCFQCLPTSLVSVPAQQVLPSHHANNMVGFLSPSVGEAWCTSFY